MKKMVMNWPYAILFVLALLGWMSVIATASHMLTPWWRIPGWALAASVLFVKPLGAFWAKWSRSKKAWVNRGLALAVTAGVLSGVGLLLNYCFERPGAEVATERYVIERLYRTKHQNRRRVGRHYVSTGSVHYRWHAEIELEGGRRMEVPLGFERYRRLRAGRDSVDVAIHHGLLGADYLTPKSRQ